MAVTSTPYRNALSQAFQGKINWASDTIKCLLVKVGSTYTPNFDTDTFEDVVTAIGTNETTGTGYTAGGQALTSKTQAYTAANSWGVSWAATTAYTVGQVIRPATGNGHLYRCISTSGTGTSGGTTPTFPTTIGGQVTDNAGANQIIWEECGTGITVLGAASVSWATSTISAIQAVLYDSTPASNKPLVALVDFGGTVSSTSGTFQVTIDANLGVIYFTTQ